MLSKEHAFAIVSRAKINQIRPQLKKHLDKASCFVQTIDTMFMGRQLLKFYFPAIFLKSLRELDVVFVDHQFARHVVQQTHDHLPMHFANSFTEAKVLPSEYQYDALVQLYLECK